jgi:competence protein ComEA
MKLSKKNQCFFMVMKQMFLFLGFLLFFGGCKKQEPLVISEDVIEQTEQEQHLENEQFLAEKEVVTEVKPLEEELIYVHVCGYVLNPGIYPLEKDSRIYQAVEAAGGYLPQAAKDYLNQAKILMDEEKIVVYSRKEVEGFTEDQLTESVYYGEYAVTEQSKNDSKLDLVNINEADLEELMTLPGIGESRAQLILEYRENTGEFQSIEEIQQVNGIKEGLFEKLKDKITIR